MFFFFLPRMLYAACMQENKTAHSLCLQAVEAEHWRHTHKHTHTAQLLHIATSQEIRLLLMTLSFF